MLARRGYRQKGLGIHCRLLAEDSAARALLPDAGLAVVAEDPDSRPSRLETRSTGEAVVLLLARIVVRAEES